MSFQCPCQRSRNAEARRKYSGLPAYTEREMLAVTRDYIMHYSALRNSASNWLVYMGRSGCGKSTQAFMVVDALLRRREPVYAKVYYYPELVRELSALRFDSARYDGRIDELMEPELLLLDDFLDVVPKAESFEESVALSLIKRRYQLRKPLILTTEVLPSTFQKLMPRHCEALLGRIYEMSQGHLEISTANAPNYRFQQIAMEAKS